MTSQHEANIARARELDDEYPDDVCPGCHQDITGWQAFRSHYKATSPAVLSSSTRERRVRLLVPWPFTDSTHTDDQRLCDWDRDALGARAFGRRLIAGTEMTS